MKFNMDQSKKGFLPVLQVVRLSAAQRPTSAEEREKMSVIPYASSIGSIIYAMLCTRLSGEICLHEHLWGPSPFLVRRGAEVARRADRGDAHKGFTQLRAARMRKTLLLLCGLYCVLVRER